MHVPRVPATGVRCATELVCVGGRYLGGWGRGSTHPGTHPGIGIARAQPVVYLRYSSAQVLVRGLFLGLQPASAACLTPQGPYALRSSRLCSRRGTRKPGVRRAQEGPGVPGGASDALQDQYGRDFRIYILKLVIKPECRRKSVMRPAILPDSKTRPKVTTLNFQDFH